MRLFSPIISGSAYMSSGSTLFGTASQALTASYIKGSVFDSNNLAFSASYALSASVAFSASYAFSSSYVNGNIFTSTNPATSASYALSASYVNGNIFTSANPAFSASYALSSSVAFSASYVKGDVFTSANPAFSASYALTASFASNINLPSLINTGSGAGTIAQIITGSLTISSSLATTPSLTVSNGLTVTTGGATVTAGGLTVTAGGLTVNDGGALIKATNGTIVISGSLSSAPTGQSTASIFIYGSIIPSVNSSLSGNAAKSSSFSLGSLNNKWNAVYASKGVFNSSTIELLDGNDNLVNAIKADNAVPKDPQNPQYGYFYPLNSTDAGSNEGDYANYRTPYDLNVNKHQSATDRYVRAGFGFQSKYHSTQLGDVDAAYRGGIGVSLNAAYQAAYNITPFYYTTNSLGEVTSLTASRPDLRENIAAGLRYSTVFETDITQQWAPAFSTTASLLLVTSSLLDVLTSQIISRPNISSSQPALFIMANDLLVTEKEPASIIAFAATSSSTTSSQNINYTYLNGIPNEFVVYTTYYFQSASSSTQTLQNLVSTINYVASSSATFKVTASISASNLILKSKISSSNANYFYAYTPKFGTYPLYFSGGTTFVPGQLYPAEGILWNDVTSSGLYKYGMGIRVLTYGDDGQKYYPYTELGDFNYVGNKTRLVVDDKYQNITLEASQVDIVTANKITIGSDRSQNNNYFFGNLQGTASYASNGGVTRIIAGTNIAISPTNGLGAVTISSTAGGGGGTGSLGANQTGSFVSSSVWSFTHALGNRYVIIQTFDSNWNQILPQIITLTDSNTATITFPAQQSGYAIASLGGTVNTSAFVTTGSNRFNGNQIITGSLNVTAGITGSLLGTASYAITASYALNGGGSGNGFPYNGAVTPALVTGSLIVSGSGITVTGSIISTLGFTGSLQGTSSWATNAISASFLPVGTYNITSSWATNAISALTASYANNFTVANTLTAQTLVVQTITSSIDYITGSSRFGSLLTNTHQFTGSVGITGSLNVIGNGITGSLLGTASWANNAITSSYILNAISSSFASTASYVVTALTASYITSSNIVGTVTSASYALNSTSASYAVTSSYAQTLTIQSTLTTYTSSTTLAGVNTLFTQVTSSYNSAFGKYTILSGSNARAGQFMTVWNSGSITYTDVATTDIGSTSDVVFSSSFSNNNILLQASASAGWTIKMLTNFI